MLSQLLLPLLRPLNLLSRMAVALLSTSASIIIPRQPLLRSLLLRKFSLRPRLSLSLHSPRKLCSSRLSPLLLPRLLKLRLSLLLAPLPPPP